MSECERWKINPNKQKTFYGGCEPPYLGEAGFKLNETAKGVQSALIKCMAIREEKPLTNKELENTIGAEFKNYFWAEISKATQEQLKKSIR